MLNFNISKVAYSLRWHIQGKRAQNAWTKTECECVSCFLKMSAFLELFKILCFHYKKRNFLSPSNGVIFYLSYKWKFPWYFIRVHKILYNGFYCRWTRLRLTMEPFPAIFEPLTESVVIGLLASWAMSYLWEFSAALMFIKHVLVWFILDFILLRCVQGVSEFSLLVVSARN